MVIANAQRTGVGAGGWGCKFTNVTFTGGRATARSHENRSRGGVLSCRVRWHRRGGMRVPYVDYRGPNAWHVEIRCSIATTTRHILALQPENQRSFCPRSLELTEDKNAQHYTH